MKNLHRSRPALGLKGGSATTTIVLLQALLLCHNNDCVVRPVSAFAPSTKSAPLPRRIPFDSTETQPRLIASGWHSFDTKTASSRAWQSHNNNNNRRIAPSTTTTTTALSMSPKTANNQMALDENTVPQVFGQRWVQLGYLSVLALISDWICFSVAAVPGTYEQAFGHSAATLIDLFLFTNVVSSFLVTDLVDKFGLQRAIQGAALLMAVGCWFRSGLSFLPGLAAVPHVMSYASIVIGTICVGAAQPFFQCTPPVLSATWFAASERATSTAIALNFNQIGIATAFLVGGSMATTVPGLESYFGLIAVLSTVAAAGTLLQFENEPPIPPSASELEKKLSGAEEPPFLESVQQFFATQGFTKALAAFICSISITNIVGAFLEDILRAGGIASQFSIDLCGAGFEFAILLGGIVIGGFVDRTKEYKNVTLACLVATAILCVPLGLGHVSPFLLIGSLLGLGVAAGPVQPINAELAVDVTYPGDETAVESVQQIGGNLVSALLVPVAEVLAKKDFGVSSIGDGLASFVPSIRGDALLLVGLACLTLAYFNTFDAPLARTLADEEGGGEAATTTTEEEEATQTAAIINGVVTADEHGGASLEEASAALSEAAAQLPIVEGEISKNTKKQ